MTTPDPLPSATRVRKARRSSVVACRHYVLVGQVIVRRDGRWTCLECALGPEHAAAVNAIDTILGAAEITTERTP